MASVSPLRPYGTHRPAHPFEGRSNTRKRRRFKEVARGLPRAPGVYFFYGHKDRLLYVGKAKCLRERVGSYFAETSVPRPAKLRRLLAEVERVDWRQVGSEFEALLLERRLIVELRPLLNRQHKRFEVYPYLVLTDEAFPRLTVTRAEPVEGEVDRETEAFMREISAKSAVPGRASEPAPRAGEVPGVYLGPFTTPKHAFWTFEAVRSLFPLRSCDGTIVPDPAGRGCFYREIKRCSGPCVGEIDPTAYSRICDDLVQLLRTGQAPQVDALRRRMLLLSDQWRFEEAAEVKLQLEAIELVATRLRRLARTRREHNLIVVQPGYEADGAAHSSLFLIRGGVVRRQIAVRGSQDWGALRDAVRAVYGEPVRAQDFTAKTELDEMMIIDRWLRVHGSEACCVWMNDRTSRQWLSVTVRKLRSGAEDVNPPETGGTRPVFEAALSHHCANRGNESALAASVP